MKKKTEVCKDTLFLIYFYVPVCFNTHPNPELVMIPCSMTVDNIYVHACLIRRKWSIYHFRLSRPSCVHAPSGLTLKDLLGEYYNNICLKAIIGQYREY